MEQNPPGDELLFILVESGICCDIFMSDSDLSLGQSSISEKCNVFEESEKGEEHEDKELSVVTETELLELGLLETFSEVLGAFAFGGVAIIT